MNKPVFADLKNVLEPELWHYINLEIQHPPGQWQGPELLLNHDELWHLELATWAGLKTPLWGPWPSLYERVVHVTGEINQRLSKADADRWAKKSAEYSQQLSRGDLPFNDGVATIQEWLIHLRHCLKAMGEETLLPRPDGEYPTPTSAGPRPTQQDRGLPENHETVEEQEPRAVHSADFRSVNWYGSTFNFTGNQAACVRILWKAWQQGTPDLSDAYVLTEADVEQERLASVFRSGG